MLKIGQAIALHRAPKEMMEVWLHYLVCPLDKGGGKVRPIVLSETLIRIMMAAVIDTQEEVIREWMHRDDVCEERIFKQFASMKADGLSEYLLHAQELTQSRREACFVSLDVRNAFGTIHRSTILDAVQEAAPKLLPAMATLWSVAEHVMHVGVATDQWKPVKVYDGLWQGSSE